MTDPIESLILPLLRDIQARLGRLEVRMTSLELRMTAQEQHLVALSIGHPVDQGRIDGLLRHVERRQDLAGPA